MLHSDDRPETSVMTNSSSFTKQSYSAVKIRNHKKENQPVTKLRQTTIAVVNVLRSTIKIIFALLCRKNS